MTKPLKYFPLLLLALAACNEDIYHGMTEDQANRMVLELRSDSIDAGKRIDSEAEGRMWKVTVPMNQYSKALECLRRNGSPQSEHPGLGILSEESGLIPTSTQEKARFIHALSGEISTMLQCIDGVIEARVVLVIPDSSPFGFPNAASNAHQPSASVLLKTGSDLLPALEDDAIRELVAASVEDLNPTNVVIVRSCVRPMNSLHPVHIPDPDPRSAHPLRLGLIATSILLGITSLLLAIVSIAWLRSRHTPAFIPKSLPKVSAEADGTP